MEISDPEQWSFGDVAILQNQEAKRVREIGSLIVETPIQHDYEAGVEARSLLSTEELEEIDGRFTVVDVDSSGNRFIRFWVDGPPGVPMEELLHLPAEEHVEARSSQQFQAKIPQFPLFTEKTVDRAPRTPDRREGLTPGYAIGCAGATYQQSPGLGAGASATQHEPVVMARISP